ncbi:MAG: hypothetical protein QXI36_02125 [Candidatus Bathyarchaeia archaeon]
MNLTNAFLTFTTIAYFTALTFPKPLTKNLPIFLERLLMLIGGICLLINLRLNIQLLWLLYAIAWTFHAGLSYLGYIQWNVLWQKKPSSKAQIAMFTWDALVAIACLLKV